MTDPGALRTATQCPGQSTRPTLEDVLIDVLGTCPRETAGVITADHL